MCMATFASLASMAAAVESAGSLPEKTCRLRLGCLQWRPLALCPPQRTALPVRHRRSASTTSTKGHRCARLQARTLPAPARILPELAPCGLPTYLDATVCRSMVVQHVLYEAPCMRN